MQDIEDVQLFQLFQFCDFDCVVSRLAGNVSKIHATMQVY